MNLGGIMSKRIVATILSMLMLSTFLLWYPIITQAAVEPEVWDILPDDAIAPQISPQDIMSLPLAKSEQMINIPRHIHQSWMVAKLPSRMSRWSQTCRAQHRHWQWILWTDVDNLNMVETYFPWFLDTYRSLPAEINRADVSRNMYMYLFGGVYLDLDTECLKPFDNLFHYHNVSLTNDLPSQMTAEHQVVVSEAQSAFFGRMGYDGKDDTLYHTIPNAWMAASPGHPFFLLVLERLQAATIESQNETVRITAEELTGPVALYRAIEEYHRLVNMDFSFETHFANNPSYALFERPSLSLRMEVLPPINIFPYSWNDEGKPYRDACWANLRSYNSRKCKALVTTSQSYAITYWSHSWGTNLHTSFGNSFMVAFKKVLGL